MNVYESVLIVRQDASQKVVDSIVEKIGAIIEKDGGSVGRRENWGLRDLAYRIKKYRRGYYVLLNHRSSGEAVREISRQLRLMSEDVIRSLTVRLEGDMPDDPSIMMRARERDSDGERESRHSAGGFSGRSGGRREGRPGYDGPRRRPHGVGRPPEGEREAGDSGERSST